VSADFKGLFIATPAYLGGVHAAFCAALVQTAQHLTHGKIRWRNDFFTGASAVQIARGVLCAKFLASGYSHLMFIDADIAWKMEAIRKLLAASEHHDVCCGVYPLKSEPLQFPVNFELDGENPIVHPETGFLKLRDACTGFMMIRRRAIEQMIAAYPERKCTFRPSAPADEEAHEYNLFDFFIDADGRYLSEDFGFTRLYQRTGGEIWADPDISLDHHGHKLYQGCIRDIMEPA
jgi:hypothetical protein